jgi:hypothetical protein
MALARTVLAVPVAPSNLTVTATQAHNVTLSWDSDPSPTVNYRVYVATGATGKFNLAGTADWTLLATVSRTAVTTTFNYTGHAAEDFAWYHIRAFDGSGELVRRGQRASARTALGGVGLGGSRLARVTDAPRT